MSKRKEKETNEIGIRIFVCFILSKVKEEIKKRVFWILSMVQTLKNIYFNIKKKKYPNHYKDNKNNNE